jgi:hypothetical protein
MEHLNERSMIDIATRATEPTETELTHLKECEKCRHLVLVLSLKVSDPKIEGAA